MEQSLFKKLVVTQLVKFPAYYGSRRSITMFTRGRYRFVSRAGRIQPRLSHPFTL